MVKNNWYCCPKCGRKLFPVSNRTVIKDLEYMCKHCKEKFLVNLYDEFRVKLDLNVVEVEINGEIIKCYISDIDEKLSGNYGRLVDGTILRGSGTKGIIKLIEL